LQIFYRSERLRSERLRYQFSQISFVQECDVGEYKENLLSVLLFCFNSRSRSSL